MTTGAAGSPPTREKSPSLRVMARTRAMLPLIDTRPLSSVSGLTPRFDCRICSMEWIAASGFDTSWQTPASMKPRAASRCVCASTGRTTLSVHSPIPLSMSDVVSRAPGGAARIAALTWSSAPLAELTIAGNGSASTSARTSPPTPVHRGSAGARSSCGSPYGRPHDHALVDRHAQHRGDDRKTDRREPHELIGAGRVEDLATRPGADEAAELMAEKRNGKERRQIFDAEDLADERVGERHGREPREPEHRGKDVGPGDRYRQDQVNRDSRGAHCV